MQGALQRFGWAAAIAVPLFYLLAYTPYGMDTTDFGYFYGYGWRILNGQIPYRDFFYIKPALPLYWHAFWLWLTPFKWQILAGKAGFCISLLASSWLGCLYLARHFSFARLGLNLPIAATASFVFAIHSFPHMPWHTADGVLFGALALYASARNHFTCAGLAAGCAILCKQSFAPLPLLLLALIWLAHGWKSALRFGAGTLLPVLAWCLWLWHNGALEESLAMTTGQLDIAEALDAGLLIYLRQNWLLPLMAIAPALLCRALNGKVPAWLAPAWCYLLVLTIWYVWQVFTTRTWIGYGASWPTLFMLLGAAAIFFPGRVIIPFLKAPAPSSALRASLFLACPLCLAWCAAISGGYKIPAMFAAPLLFSAFLIHALFFKSCRCLQTGFLAAGLIMFWAGYQYPYVFPQRPLERADLRLDAGEVYPQASGVKIDEPMYELLLELKMLRQKYGPGYKTLPGFTLAYFLNGDRPVIRSDWLIDWEINGKVAEIYEELMDKDVIVFMEKDQLDATQADGYARAGYGAPQRVRHNWKIIEETPHFIVFQKPDKPNN